MDIDSLTPLIPLKNIENTRVNSATIRGMNHQVGYIMVNQLVNWYIHGHPEEARSDDLTAPQKWQDTQNIPK